MNESPTATLPISNFMITHFYEFIDPHCKFINIATNETSILSTNDYNTKHFVQIIIGKNRNSSQFNITYIILDTIHKFQKLYLMFLLLQIQ